jgi:hypothetical protein
MKECDSALTSIELDLEIFYGGDEPRYGIMVEAYRDRQLEVQRQNILLEQQKQWILKSLVV